MPIVQALHPVLFFGMRGAIGKVQGQYQLRVERDTPKRICN